MLRDLMTSAVTLHVPEQMWGLALGTRGEDNEIVKLCFPYSPTGWPMAAQEAGLGPEDSFADFAERARKRLV